MKPSTRILAASVCVSVVAALAADIVRLRPQEALYVDSRGGGLKEPGGVGCGPGLIAVADSGNARLVTYAVSERGVTPRAEFVIPELSLPTRVEVTPSGDLLVQDGRSRRIGRVAMSGEFRGWLEPAGEPAPGAIAIRSFTVGADGRIYVLDVLGARVLVLDPTGRVERTIALAKDRGFPSDLAVDGRGDVYVLDSVLRRVDAARDHASATTPLGGSLTQDVDFPTALAVDEEGRMFLVDTNGGGIVVLGRDGSFRGRQLSMGWKDGFLRYPSDACVLAGGSLAIADRGNNRVQLFAIAQ